MATQKRVWLFHEGNATMRDLLGGKGANLAEMSNIGLPVPPGFTITTEVCNDYYAERGFPAGLMDEVKARWPRSRIRSARPSAIPRTRFSSPCAPAPSSRCRA